MLRLLREGDRLSLPTPQEDDGSFELVPSLPSLQVWSSVLDAAEVELLQRQLQAELTTALIQSQSAGHNASQIAPEGQRIARVDLRHLPLPRNEKRRLEDHIGVRLAELLGERVTKYQGGRMGVLAATCVATTPGDGLSVATLQDLLAKPHPELDPNLPMKILVLPPSGDVLILEIFPWPAPVLPSDEVQVGLGSAVDWAKQIVGWTVCPPHYHQYVRTDGKEAVGYMKVSRADNLSAIVFRKPKVFGIWFDIFYFGLPEFIDVLGGRYAGFTWYRD
jgi:hypothetical protein